MDLLLAVVTGRGDEPLEHRQAGTDHALAAQPLDGVTHQRQRAVVAERAIGNRRSQRLEVLVAARPEAADRHRLREVLGPRAAFDVQPCRRDRRQLDIQLAGDQRRSLLGQLVERCGHEPQPPQCARGDGDREAAMHATIRRDGLELVVGEAEECRQRGLVDLLGEALPL